MDFVVFGLRGGRRVPECKRSLGEYGEAFGAGVGMEMDVGDRGVVEEVGFGGGGN